MSLISAGSENMILLMSDSVEILAVPVDQHSLFPICPIFSFTLKDLRSGLGLRLRDFSPQVGKWQAETEVQFKCFVVAQQPFKTAAT